MIPQTTDTNYLKYLIDTSVMPIVKSYSEIFFVMSDRGDDEVKRYVPKMSDDDLCDIILKCAMQSCRIESVQKLSELSRITRVVHARQIASYLMHKHTNKSYSEIGRKVTQYRRKSLDHSTIIHSVKVAQSYIDNKDYVFCQRYNECISRLESLSNKQADLIDLSTVSYNYKTPKKYSDKAIYKMVEGTEIKIQKRRDDKCWYLIKEGMRDECIGTSNEECRKYIQEHLSF